MKYLVLILILVSNTFAMDLIVIELSNDNTFNYFASIFFNFSIILVPIFGAISLAKN